MSKASFSHVVIDYLSGDYISISPDCVPVSFEVYRDGRVEMTVNYQKAHDFYKDAPDRPEETVDSYVMQEIFDAVVEALSKVKLEKED